MMDIFGSLLKSDFTTNLSGTLCIIVYFLVIIKYIQWLWSRRHLYMISWKVDGPIALPFIGNAIYFLKFASRTKEILEVVKEFRANYNGPSRLWIGPDLYISVTDPEDIEVIFKSRNIVAKPPKVFDVGSEMFGSGVVSLTGFDGTWKHHSKIISPSFKTSILKSYHSTIQENTQTFIKDFEKYIGIKDLEFPIYVERFIADVTTETLLNHKQNFRDGKSDEMIHALNNMTDIWFSRLYRIWYQIKFLYNMSSMRQEQLIVTNTFNKFAENVFNAKLAEFNNNEDLGPNVIHNLMDNYMKGELSKAEVLDEIKTVWVAGADTMAIAICWLFLMLGIHKDKQEKAFQEIKQYYKNNMMAPVELDDLAHFPYVEMCIKESLRLFPVAPVSFRYVTEPVEIKHRNITIPPDVTICLPTMITYRDPRIWTNPDTYAPERFSPEECSKRHPYSFVPFSGGIRKCIGQRYGMQVIKTVAVYFLRNYEIHSDEKHDELQLIINVNTKPRHGFKATFTKRTLT